MKRRLSYLVLALGVVALEAAFVSAAKKVPGTAAKTEFLRLTRDDRDEPLAMQTAIVRYKSADDDKRA